MHSEASVARGDSTVLHFEQYPRLARFTAVAWCLLNGVMAAVMGQDHFSMALLPLFFLSLGLVAALGRYRITLDATRRLVISRFGWFLWFGRGRRSSLSDFNWVALRVEVTQDENSTTMSYGVFLVGPTALRRLEESDDLLVARSTAERVAKLAGLGVSDEVTHSGYREPGALDEPLKARLHRVHAPPALTPPPPRLSVEVLADELRVKLPPAEALAQLTLALSWCGFAAMGCVPALIVLSGLAHPSLAGDKLLSAVLGFSGLPLVVVAAVVLRRDMGQLEREVSLFVSPRALRAEIKGPRGLRRLALAADELESVGVGYRTRLGWFPRLGPPRLIACADRKIIAFGVSCTPEEHAWLIRAIHWYLRDPGSAESAE